MENYQLIDSGDGKKFEQFGKFSMVRPAGQAVWHPTLEYDEWKKADASFTRNPSNEWRGKEKLPKSWTVTVSEVKFKLVPTEFGHLGIFPEQQVLWRWIQEQLSGKKARVLNLFAYSGGSTLAAAKAGAEVCHLDAAKGMVDWAKENAKLNQLEKAPIRWIVDDALKFLKREIRRGREYDALILDPPTFGRGAKGEVFKIEEDIQELLSCCRALLSDKPQFILFSCHSPGFTETVLSHLLSQTCEGLGGKIETGEMQLLGGDLVLPLPSGFFARWTSG